MSATETSPIANDDAGAHSLHRMVSTREHDFVVAHQRYKAAERSTERVQTKTGTMALAVTLNRMLKAAEMLAEEIGERANIVLSETPEKHE